jgi:hypothetical protein
MSSSKKCCHERGQGARAGTKKGGGRTQEDAHVAPDVAEVEDGNKHLRLAQPEPDVRCGPRAERDVVGVGEEGVALPSWMDRVIHGRC